MKLQTTIPLSSQNNQISYDSKIALLGSCFSENMGDLLEYFKFQILQNPFGIIFNPLSSELILKRAANKEYFTEADLFEKDGQWHCFEVHSLVTASDQLDYLKLLNTKLDELRAFITSSSHIILTYGTAWVYRSIRTNSVVANCHKIPQNQFSKELLSVEQISEAIKNSIAHIRSLNSKTEIITTISPVRHLKDGFVENARSKAHLLSGLHMVVEQEQSIHYFPSYEVMMDELRDYRFYSSDMLHPNETAISVIWEKFSRVWISSETDDLRKEIDSIQKGLKHRPFNPESTEHRKFQKNLTERINKIKRSLPKVNFK